MMQHQRLDGYRRPPTYRPGAARWIQGLWFCIGAPLVAARWCPGSQWRSWLLSLFGARIGRCCRIKPGVRIKFPWRLSVGDHCWLGEDVWIDNLADVVIGSHVCLSQGAYLCTGNHNYRKSTFDLSVHPIQIGDGAWIAAMVRIGPGAVIGVDAVVQFGAVLTGSVADAQVMAGNPARPVRHRWS